MSSSSEMRKNLDTTRIKTNQAALVQNPLPPNMGGIKNDMLRTASPKFFNLPSATRTDNTSSDAALNFCRTKYTGFGGLRQLQKDQKNQTVYDPGCGWRFQMAPGSVTPSVNQAAYGNFTSPMRPGANSPDHVGGGITWSMELDKAERDAASKMATNLNNKCTNLQYLTNENKQYFGFCKTSGSIIPIQIDSTGTPSARFPNIPYFNCDPASIVPASSAPSGCAGTTSTSIPVRMPSPATTSGFRNYKESFTGDLTSINDLDNCTSPLTRDCLVLAARASGCDIKGSLIAALEGTQGGDDYSKNLQNNSAYKAYSAIANPGITSAILTNGAAALGTAINDFANLAKNAQSSNSKLAAASRDLCSNSGYYDTNYDWCSELTPTSLINTDTIACAQSSWKNQGGTEQGSAYPTLNTWNGKTFQSLNKFVQGLLTNINSKDKSTQDDALSQFIGTSSGYKAIITPTVNPTNPGTSTILEKNAQTNGAETVWIEMGDYWNGEMPPVIMRCDLRTAENGEIIPKLMSPNDPKQKYNLASMYSVAFFNAFEYRAEYPTTLEFSVASGDGFMLSINQNPFEDTTYMKNDWGSWKYQKATQYKSGVYNISQDSDTNRNVVVTKFFAGAPSGGAAFTMLTREDGSEFNDPSSVSDARANMYITQEPLAPWLQYELCSRPNDGKGKTVGFFEKRWNGPCGYYQNQGINSPIPAFDVETSGGVVTQTDSSKTHGIPGGKGYLSFTGNSTWQTLSFFAFTGFQTITLLVRPAATLGPNSVANIFEHASEATKSGKPVIEMAVVNLVTSANGKYMFYLRSGGNESTAPCVANEWNLIVLQYNGDKGGITNVQIDAMDLQTLQTPNGLTQMFTRIVSHQNKTGAYLVKTPSDASMRNFYSGTLLLGSAGSGTGFTGDVAWLHGFRLPFTNIHALQSEVMQTWISRWPRPNFDIGTVTPPHVVMPRKPECTSSHGSGITLRENCDPYSGWSQVLPVGEYDLTKTPGVFPTDASYIIVPSGFKATIFTGPLDQGRSKSFEGPAQWSFCTEGWWANDKIRSIRVTPGAGNKCTESFVDTPSETAPSPWSPWKSLGWGVFKW